MSSPGRARRVAVLAMAAACLTSGCTQPDEPDLRLPVADRLSGDTSGYRQVTAPRVLRFPGDHGPHPDYKHEWWYMTGQVAAPGGRRFGFQFTLFREAVAPARIESPSSWATNQLYLAHAAVTDIDGARYLSDERFARGALGLAGAAAAPFRVWLEDWELKGQADDDGGLVGRVAAQSDRFGFELNIRNTRPPTAHGDRGLSSKGSAGVLLLLLHGSRCTGCGPRRGGIVRGGGKSLVRPRVVQLGVEGESVGLGLVFPAAVE